MSRADALPEAARAAAWSALWRRLLAVPDDSPAGIDPGDIDPGEQSNDEPTAEAAEDAA
jgi:hypothetical protein